MSETFNTVRPMAESTLANEIELVDISTKMGSSTAVVSTPTDTKVADVADVALVSAGNEDRTDSPVVHARILQFEQFDQMSKARVALILFRYEFAVVN